MCVRIYRNCTTSARIFTANARLVANARRKSTTWSQSILHTLKHTLLMSVQSRAFGCVCVKLGNFTHFSTTWKNTLATSPEICVQKKLHNFKPWLLDQGYIGQANQAWNQEKLLSKALLTLRPQLNIWQNWQRRLNWLPWLGRHPRYFTHKSTTSADEVCFCV